MRLTEWQRKEIVRLYTTPTEDGTWVGATTIARFFNVTCGCIYPILRKQGIHNRDARQSHASGKRCKPIKNLPVGFAPICKCGCGKVTTWNRRKNHWNVYVIGHYHPNQGTRKHGPPHHSEYRKPYQDKEWLYNAYITENKTSTEIANLAKVGTSSIIKALHHFDIPVRTISTSRMGRHAGDKNHAWKGGVSPERQRLYKAGHWREFCKTIYARDNYHCVRCGSPKLYSKGLHAHHVIPWANNKTLRFILSNIITICRPCHLWIHSTRNEDKEFLIP